jgi:hypothetical protein
LAEAEVVYACNPGGDWEDHCFRPVSGKNRRSYLKKKKKKGWMCGCVARDPEFKCQCHHPPPQKKRKEKKEKLVKLIS